MKPIKDVYWIEVEKETEDTMMLNGVELYRDTSYDPMKLARQYGTVYKTPMQDSKNLGIQEGDKVWFQEPEQSESGIFLESSASEVHLHGKAVILNDWMKDNGVDEGDRIMWSENSEYDMDIDGRKLLRMRNFDVLGVYEGAE
jgi:co-chaperonin GroES (HSP10)